MNSNKFIQKFIFSTVCLLTLVAFLNFIVDPGSIYLRKILLEKKKKDIYDLYLKSKFGIHYDGNERFLKLLLAQFSKDKDCVFIGSSHLMQVSYERGEHIREVCTSVLNLGVSGGTFEDIFVFLGALEKYDKIPRKLFIGIDPWTLKPGLDSRYSQFSDYLKFYLDTNNFSADVFADSLGGQSGATLLNLLNLEYTRHTVEYLRRLDSSFYNKSDALYSEVLEDTKDTLSEKPVVLADGSYIYSKEHILKSVTGRNYEAEPSYKLSENTINDDSLSFLRKGLKKLKSKTQVTLVMTPYHFSAFKPKYSEYLKYFKDVNKAVLHLSKELNIEFLGSFWPDQVGCSAEEFYDFMHPKTSCVDKIFK